MKLIMVEVSSTLNLSIIEVQRITREEQLFSMR